MQKAIEAALNARQYSRALQLVDTIASDSSKPYYKQLARHYEDSRQYDLAERCYVSADQPQLAVEMHTKLGHWEIAHKLAMSYMSEGEVGLLYINQAQKLETLGRFREAEKLYLTVKEKDLVRIFFALALLVLIILLLLLLLLRNSMVMSILTSFFSACCSFYSYAPHFPSPFSSPPIAICHSVIGHQYVQKASSL